MITILLPIKTVSEANVREHWAIRSKRARQHRHAARLNVMYHRPFIQLPVTITLTRLGPRKLDSDNLAISFKHIRDGIADAIGVDDGDDKYLWKYEQEQATQYGLRIEIRNGR